LRNGLVATAVYDGTSWVLVAAPVDAPLPKTASGLGQWVQQNFSFGVAAVLPAGGRWAYFFMLLNSGVVANIAAGEGAGGASVGTAVPGQNWTGFAWRVS